MSSFSRSKLFVFIMAKIVVITSSFLIDNQETVKHFALFELASNIIENVNVGTKTLLIMDMWKTLHIHGLVDETPKLIYTSDSLRLPRANESNCACMKTRTEFKPALTVIIVRIPDSNVSRLLENNYHKETLMLVYLVRESDGKDLSRTLTNFCCPRRLQIFLIAYWSTEHESLQWFTYNVLRNLLYNRTGQYEFGSLIRDTSKDLYGFNFKSCLIDDPPYTKLVKGHDDYIAQGLEGMVFNTITRSLNVSNRFVEPLPKNTSLIAAYIYYAENDLCDVIFTKSVTPFSLNKIENLLQTLEFDDWCIMVAAGTRIHGLHNLVMPFQPTVWYIVIAVSIALIFVWNISTKILKRLGFDMDMRISNLDVFGLFLNMALPVDFRRLAFNTKIYILSVAVYAFLLTYFYQSILTGALMRPVFHEDMHTLKEVEASRLSIFAYSEELHFWQRPEYSGNASSNITALLVGQLTKEMLYRFMETNNRTVAYLIPSSLIEFVIQRKRDEDGHPLYHKVEECVHPIMYTYAASCDFPFGRRIEELYQRLMESGLRGLWKQDRGVIFPVSKFDESHDDPRKIGLENMIGPLYIWIVGITISVLYFIYEVICNK